MKTITAALPATGLETLEMRYALRVVARLNEQAEAMDGDLGERLRFAREQALERARAHHSAAGSTNVVATTAAGAATLSGPSGWWLRLGSVLPLLLLLGGLMLIQQWSAKAQISAAAEIDAALLADDLPPRAYSDPAFVEFLKAPRD
jgi:hypothetical protein